jgi:hypothetical protein
MRKAGYLNPTSTINYLQPKRSIFSQLNSNIMARRKQRASLSIRDSSDKPLPHSVQLGSLVWYYPDWKQLESKKIHLGKIEIDLTNFPWIKLKKNDGNKIRVRYHRQQHKYVKIPIDQGINPRCYLLFTYQDRHLFYDSCRIGTNLSVKKGLQPLS